MADSVTDAELEKALARVIEREAEQMASEKDSLSEFNLRRWVEDMQRALRTNRSQSEQK